MIVTLSGEGVIILMGLSQCTAGRSKEAGIQTVAYVKNPDVVRRHKSYSLVQAAIPKPKPA